MLWLIKSLHFTLLRIFLTIFVYLTMTVNGDNENINCPRFCKCDSYHELNRAQCRCEVAKRVLNLFTCVLIEKNLISAEIDLPYQVQLLDLSRNDITTVNNKCFMRFFHLEYLNLANNALHTLEWDAFAKLRRLKEIDLSYNRLEYLDERLFVKNLYLKKINLEGNKLESLENRPLLQNAFVVQLNLKNSQLNFLPPQMFAGLTNLKFLDLSKNLLNNFNVEDFWHLPNLRILNLNKNFIKCNEIIKKKLKQLEERGVNVSLDSCLTERDRNTKQNTHMEQKNLGRGELSDINQWNLKLPLEEAIIEENSKEEMVASAWQTNEWLRFAPDAILCSRDNLIFCREYRSCLKELNNILQEQNTFKQQYPLNDVKLAFAIGLAFGAATVVFILVCALCLKKYSEGKKTVTEDRSSNDDTNDLPNQPLARLNTQLPAPVRRQPRRRAAQRARSVVRYEGPVAENFLSRLFGRPARHQYYRTINQNTATLIRRLSRSNLFNNRVSQHFVERQISNEVQDFAQYPPRCETPPPSYRDAVVINSSEAK